MADLNSTATKVCASCGVEKLVSAFYRGKCGRHESQCKQCRLSRQKASRDANPEKSRASVAAWKAKNPDRQKAAIAAWQARNRDKVLEASRAWRERNPEKQKEHTKKWRANNAARVKATKAAWRAANREVSKLQQMEWRAANPEAARLQCLNRRARMAAVGGALSKGIASRLLELQCGKCVCCRKSLDDGYHIDHIMPLALGGSNTDENVQLLCPSCNQQKHAKHPIDFMRDKGYLL